MTAGPGKNGLLSVGRFFGLHAALIMMVQLLLVARLPWLDRRIGMDRLTSWHRWVGFTLFWTVVLHATFIVLGYARLDGASVAADVPEPGRRARLAARDLRRGDHRHRRGALGAVRPAPACRTRPGTPSTSSSTSRSCSACMHQVAEGTDVHARRRPPRRTGGRLWALVARRPAGRPGGAAAVAQRLPPVPGRRGRPRVRQRRVGLRHRAATSTGCRRGPASSSSGGSSPRAAGGRPTRSRCPPRPTAGRCG